MKGIVSDGYPFESQTTKPKKQLTIGWAYESKDSAVLSSVP